MPTQPHSKNSYEAVILENLELDSKGQTISDSLRIRPRFTHGGRVLGQFTIQGLRRPGNYVPINGIDPNGRQIFFRLDSPGHCILHERFLRSPKISAKGRPPPSRDRRSNSSSPTGHSY